MLYYFLSFSTALLPYGTHLIHIMARASLYTPRCPLFFLFFAVCALYMPNVGRIISSCSLIIVSHCSSSVHTFYTCSIPRVMKLLGLNRCCVGSNALDS